MTNAGTITIIGYTGPGGSVSIPSTINGLPVSSIGQDAFYELSRLTGVTIPGSVASIGASAFEDCTGLTSVTIPGSVSSIGASAFADCTSLTSITISDGVAGIGDHAFAVCTRLTNVTVPASVAGIGDLAFGGCAGLIAITVDSNSSFYCSVNGVLFDKSQTTLLEYPGGLIGSYVIPGSVTSVGAQAFELCSGLTSVTIPGSVTSVGDFAFENTSLATVTIPDGVTNIGEGAFTGCTSLTSVTIAGSVASIGDGAFQLCPRLTTVAVLSGVSSIGADAFYASGLTSVTIPGSVTNIGEEAFALTALTTVTILAGVSNIADGAFESCIGLAGVYFGGKALTIGANVFSPYNSAVAYYLPGATGWSSSIGGIPTALWNPLIQTGDGSFGVSNNQFGFNVTGPTNTQVVVEACINLANPVWTALGTLTLYSGSCYFTDPGWTNFHTRFYGLGLP